jgi:hypothetical protein
MHHQVELHEGSLHRSNCTGAFFKTVDSAKEWGPTSSTNRSGWHSRTDPEDISFTFERLRNIKESIKNRKQDGKFEGNRIEEVKDDMAEVVEKAFPENEDHAQSEESTLGQKPTILETHVKQPSSKKVSQTSKRKSKSRRRQNYKPKTKTKFAIPDDFDSWSFSDNESGNESEQSTSEDSSDGSLDGEWRGDTHGFICLDPHTQNTERYAELANKTLEGRVFFILANGYFGVGPDGMEEGDTVAIFRGCKTPFILRQARGKKESMWRILGDAYVHGIMRGEAVRMDGVGDRNFLLV